ncbi:MAG: iron-sulfur cluster carrier protein ApbC [Sphingomonadales bacterium]|jgi:ATP-binding protein involved in chromosome partitioning
MTTLDKDLILKTLSTVIDPDSGKDIVSTGMVQGLSIRDGHVGFALEVGAEGAAKEPLRQAAEAAVKSLPGVTKATVVLTAEQETSASTPAPQPKPQGIRGLPGIGAIIAVASGKGGVGKSTVAVNLALALSKMGKRVGLLDADIYGPSVPRLLGLEGKPDSDGKKLKPKEAYGLKAMSIGLLVDVDTPMIWRGPMATSALSQMLQDVDWAPLDILVVDMPPGTGDIQLTMAQKVPLTGAVIVSTPQDIALIDARKGIAMFEKVGVPILGLVENMSSFTCPSCGDTSHIFGHGGAKETAEKRGAPFLGELPLHLSIREMSDAGTPVVANAENSPEAQAFLTVAQNMLEGLEKSGAKAAPKISMS